MTVGTWSRARAHDRHAGLGRQLAFGIERKGAVAGVGLAPAVLQLEEDAFAFQAEVQRPARLFQGALGVVAADAVIEPASSSPRTVA